VVAGSAADGSQEGWTYDGEGNLVSYVDAGGRETRMEYAGFDLLAARVDLGGARHEFTYDTELRLTSVLNPQGLVWSYRRDAAGRLVEESDVNGSDGSLSARCRRSGRRARQRCWSERCARVRRGGEPVPQRHQRWGGDGIRC